MPNGHSSDTIYELNLEIAQLKTKEIARKLLASHIFSELKQYTIRDFFRIRDALEILAGYELADMDLLAEVKKYITQKEGEKK